ncbi:hypothetical protein [Commensalibacter papalotli (ex Botero et al. 2024)]|uniref:Uncharacterized protein n=1 Tax=Commensalibacter papalotli (ex Botero et al. 2024) TaxID=2972766 RepID=A0ABM9HKU2_9PROT|nr:hypothetical protein [Commensalibacter papalotli (ex Botero et al. 2024)]CAI3932055.1 unnamed protein product [Commensalibacter papalotli (ex Botero et al. 2024)]CAI3946625.1 unnamed protein product [Commensalibacter papalotli (ex Botero et al. 2024)]
MNLRGILGLSTSLMVVCAGLMSSFAQAEDYVAKSQVNAANGVAGLNASKQITADVNNSKILTDGVQLNKKNDRLRFVTNSLDSNNNEIDMFFNRDAGNKDNLSNELDANTFYFTNNKYGNKYKFNGSVATTGDIILKNQSVFSAINKANLAIAGKYENISSYNDKAELPLIFIPDDQYIRRNTLQMGGRTRNGYVGIKATCQTTGGGDLGGSCYQFTNMAGIQSSHRGGAGETEAINMDVRTTDNSPLDVIGGNTLVKNSDGSYVVTGNDYQIAVAQASGANTFQVKGTFGCGIGYDSGQARCEMDGVNVLNAEGKALVDEHGKIIPVKVTPGVYDASKDITIVELPINYKLANSLTTTDNVNIKFYSSDGTAYAIEYGNSNVKIYPKLSAKEAALIHSRMALWTNIANGMHSTEGGNNEDAANVDMPNYYYGYEAGGSETADYSVINIETYYYPGTGQSGGWKTLNDASKTGTAGTPGNIKDAIHTNDQYDYQLRYKYPGTDTDRYNTNYHRYSKPTLFLGLTKKNFNSFSLQSYTKAPDSITRDYDNEWDFWIPNDHNGEVVTRGLTMTWGHSGSKLFATGSYMLRLAGFNNMPIGLKVDGVFKGGGKVIDTDAGFSVFSWGQTKDSLRNNNEEQVISALGSAMIPGGDTYQLFSYMSNDNPKTAMGKAAANYSLHFGATKSPAYNSLAYNHSPTCNDKNIKDKTLCSVLGQVIFDPLNYKGGIALGSGQGENTKLGLIVDKDNNVNIINKLSVNGKSVNDAIDKVEKAIPKSNIDIANGVAGLNENKEVTANINSKQVYSPFILLSNTGSIRFLTNSTDTNNLDINFFYNRDAKIDSWKNQLDANTVYFTNNHYGNNYKFIGNVGVSNQISASKFIGKSFQGQLSTPSSSTVSCNAGEFKDDTNYHYVCVAANKWKRVALSDF